MIFLYRKQISVVICHALCMTSFGLSAHASRMFSLVPLSNVRVQRMGSWAQQVMGCKRHSTIYLLTKNYDASGVAHEGKIYIKQSIADQSLTGTLWYVLLHEAAHVACGHCKEFKFAIPAQISTLLSELAHQGYSKRFCDRFAYHISSVASLNARAIEAAFSFACEQEAETCAVEKACTHIDCFACFCQACAAAVHQNREVRNGYFSCRDVSRVVRMFERKKQLHFCTEHADCTQQICLQYVRARGYAELAQAIADTLGTNSPKTSSLAHTKHLYVQEPQKAHKWPFYDATLICDLQRRRDCIKIVRSSTG